MPFHTVSAGVDEPAFQRAFAHAYQQAQRASVDMIFFAPALANVDSDAAVNFLGKALVDTLKKKGSITLNGVRVVLETKLKKRQTLGPAVLLGVYVSDADMVRAMSDHRISEAVYIPWSDNDLKGYLAKHAGSVAV